MLITEPTAGGQGCMALLYREERVSPKDGAGRDGILARA